MFKKAIQRLKALWRWLFPRQPELFIVERTVDEPQAPREKTVYLIGDTGNEWAASFICPCGCGALISLNLLSHPGRPLWTVTEGRQKLATLTPSVWRKVGCKSHFVMRDGQIIWC